MIEKSEARVLSAALDKNLADFDAFIEARNARLPPIARPLVREVADVFREHMKLTYAELIEQRRLLDQCLDLLELQENIDR